MKNDISVGNAVRIIDVIKIENVKTMKYLPYPLYEDLGDGILKENPGSKRPGMTLVYDVTNADDTFKQAHEGLIEKIEVKEIKRILKPSAKKETERTGKIVSILPINGETYSKLDSKEKKAIGSNYVLHFVQDGLIKIVDVLTLDQQGDSAIIHDGKVRRRVNGDVLSKLYIRLNTNISPEILEKVSSEIIELISVENGLYKNSDSLSKSDEKKI